MENNVVKFSYFSSSKMANLIPAYGLSVPYVYKNSCEIIVPLEL